MGPLLHRKIVVIGASAGIGRSLAAHAVARGAEVLACGRRRDRLEELVAQAGRGQALAIDVCSAPDIERLGTALSDFGPVDALVSCVGTAPLKPLAQMTADDWRAVLDTNVIGVNDAIRVALRSLAPGAVVLALSSETVSSPRWALGAYASSKAALEVAFAAWRIECPSARFGTVGIGATFPTEFGRDFEGELLGQALEVWARHGQAQSEMMDPDEVGAVLAGLLESLIPNPGVNIEHVVLRTPSAVAGGFDV